MRLRNSRGFSLIEMMTVVALIFTVCGITFMTLMALTNKNHVDQGYDTALSAIRNYRNLAITQGRRYILIFTPPSTITVQLWAYGTPASPAPVTVQTYTLPTGITFGVQPGFPNPGPDLQGTGAAAVSFNSCTVTGTECIIFFPDGSAQDDLGNYNSGVVYLVRGTDMTSSRAIDVMGTTGRIRGWRLYTSGGNQWVQQ